MLLVNRVYVVLNATRDRMLGQWILLKHPTCEVPTSLSEIFKRAINRVGLRHSVHLRLLDQEINPMVVGFIRPVVVAPISILSSMSSQEIELVLTHELAHVKRRDYLINAFQVIIETVFFFHPAVWWLFNQIRATREYCCDDMATSDEATRLVFGRALLSLEQRRVSTFAISVDDGNLLKRIRRLANSEQDTTSSRVLAITMCAAITVLLAITTATVTRRAQPAKTTSIAKQITIEKPSLPRSPLQDPMTESKAVEDYLVGKDCEYLDQPRRTSRSSSSTSRTSPHTLLMRGLRLNHSKNIPAIVIPRST